MSQYKVYRLTVATVVANAEIMYEAWKALCDPHGARLEASWETWLKIILRIAQASPELGGVFLFTSKNDKPLGMLVLVEDTQYGEEYRTAIMYAIYSSGKDVNIGRQMIAYAEKWAHDNEYIELHAVSRRMNGAAVRYFERKLGFIPDCTLYKKKV